MLKEFLNQVRTVSPLIHCITNYVTVNDCANILIACGAAPIMADEEAEVEEITSICSGLVLNIGTLNKRTVAAMFSAGAKAKELGHPVVFDPVGAGASAFRLETSQKILAQIRPDIVRCNISELKVLMSIDSISRGVDASELDRVTKENLFSAAELVRAFSAKQNCITAVSGEIDLIAAPDGRVCACFNGDPLMPLVTGSGCMLTTVAAAYACAAKDRMFESVCAAFLAMGIAGETASGLLPENGGNATFRNLMIDAFCSADPEKWEKEVRCEMF